MHTPTKKQWQTVIDNFNKVLPTSKSPDQFDMSETRVNCGHTCGTVHCIGGWYAVAVCNTTQALIYRDGALKMAQDLGFNNDTELERWAMENPEIWGNRYGESMFCSELAYNDAITLAGAVEHLEGVRDRSPE